MKITILLVLNFCLSLMAIGQSGFITNSTYDQVRTRGNSAIEVDGNIYTIGHYRDDWSNDYRGIYFAKNDRIGADLNFITDFVTGAQYNLSQSNALKQRNGKIYAFGQVLDVIRLFEYNTSDDSVVLIDSITNPYNNGITPSFYDYVFLNDDIYTACRISHPDQSIRANIYLSKINQDSIVSYEYGDSDFFEVMHNILVTEDETLLLVGSKYDSTPQVRLYLLEVDTLGNILSEYWAPPESERGFILDAILDTDDNLILSSHEYNADLRTRPYIYKTDRLGNTIWESNIGNQFWNPFGSSYSRILKSQADNNYLLAGDSWYYW